jgi:hypothetical protein
MVSSAVIMFAAGWACGVVVAGLILLALCFSLRDQFGPRF